MISWAGLRGAASIVFAIMVIAASSSSSDTLFHTVFMVALFIRCHTGNFAAICSREAEDGG